MPIYEFKCNDCGEKFSEIRKPGDYNAAKCIKCSSSKTSKIISMFSGSKSGKSCAPASGG
jgi:putative FmdB family regulatory protein